MRGVSLLSGVFFLCLSSTPASAQLPETPTLPPAPVSLGQPGRLRVTWGQLAGYHHDRRRVSARMFVNVTTRGFFPQFGIGSFTTEVAGGVVGEDFDGVIGGYVKIPWVRVGGEYSFLEEKVMPSLFTEWAITRGGLFNKGDEFRIDVRPWDGQWRVGFTFNNPFGRYRVTRPVHASARLPDGDLPNVPVDAFAGLSTAERAAVETSLERIAHALTWMDRLLTPHFTAGSGFPRSAAAYRDHVSRRGHAFYEEDARYHRELTRAFAVAAGAHPTGGVHVDTLGKELADRARAIIYSEIVVPWNRLFGQNKDPHHPKGLIAEATRSFDVYVAGHERLQRDRDRAQAVREVFTRTVRVIHTVAIDSRNRWKQAHLIWLRQSRLVWLPVNYGLQRAQYDTQAEADEVIADLTGGTFADANTIELLANEQFHLRLKEMIRRTRAYHVFIIHDFRGRTKHGPTDTIGWDAVVDGYIRAFETAVREMDAGERDRLPQFIVFLDEVYYQDNKSREIITFLEHLYDGSRLRLRNGDVQSRVLAAHKSLRRTIAESDAFGALDEDALRKLFKVHVNITNPYDPSFAHDAPLRDHRKIAFRDVFEDDPALGGAIFTGQGVGEHYNGPGWDDRSLLVRGASLRFLKDETRRLFLSQGFDESEVPFFLRSRPLPPDYDERCAALREAGWTTPLILVMNDTGFGRKRATILKAALYNLAGPGALMFAFDSLWISEFWAGMFIAAAVRGARVYPVGPAAANAPSSAAPTMYLMRDNLEMMREASDYFHEEITRAGGALHVGLYATEIPAADQRRRMTAFAEGLERHDFLANELALDPSLVEYLGSVADHYADLFPPIATDRSRVPALTSEHSPFIHMKVQFIASGRGPAVLSRPEWKGAFARHLSIRHRQSAGRPSVGLTPAALSTVGTEDGTSSLYVAFDQALHCRATGGREPAVLMLTVGSHNQDRRGMLLDGEVLVGVSGYDAAIALPDLVILLGITSWPETTEELRALFPVKAPGVFRRVYVAIKDLI